MNTFVRKIAKEIMPPFIYSAMKRIIYTQDVNSQPSWHTIRDGILKGREIFFDMSRGILLEGMLVGNHDNIIFSYLRDRNLKGKIIFDIGSWIGYHAMNFASMVGDGGLVYAFEPNVINYERMMINLNQNPELCKRVRLFDFAVSDRNGSAEFYLDRNIDSGASSGSFVGDAHTMYTRSEAYMKLFEKTQVNTIMLDSISDITGDIGPNIIKIDVEGAEGSVLRGGTDFINKHRPLIIIEVHSAYNMHISHEILGKLNYKLTLLKEEGDGRCFIAAEP